MQFVNSQTNTFTPKPFVMMGSSYYNNRPVQPNPVVAAQPFAVPDTNTPKSKWGEPTWYFFHTMAHKLKEDAPPTVLIELYKLIVLICSNLPCPTCTKHATEYLSKIDIRSITTKQDLKNLLFVFHNEVNTRKGYSLFPFSQLDTKYGTANTKNIIQHFFYYYKQKDFNISMITANMHREYTANTAQKWILQNMYAFDP